MPALITATVLSPAEHIPRFLERSNRLRSCHTAKSRRFGHHEVKHEDEREERRYAQQHPPRHITPVNRRQRPVVFDRFMRKGFPPDLQPHDRQPAGDAERKQQDGMGNPFAGRGEAGEVDQVQAGQGLEDDGGRRHPGASSPITRRHTENGAVEKHQ